MADWAESTNCHEDLSIVPKRGGGSGSFFNDDVDSACDHLQVNKSQETDDEARVLAFCKNYTMNSQLHSSNVKIQVIFFCLKYIAPPFISQIQNVSFKFGVLYFCGEFF